MKPLHKVVNVFFHFEKVGFVEKQYLGKNSNFLLK